MKPEQNEPDDDATPDGDPPDGRGERPTDPNELAKWIAEQTADDSEQLHDQD